MNHNFGRDLRVARRKSALSQADCAHLQGVNYSRISKLEAGRRLPTALELAILVLVLDQPAAPLIRELGFAVAEVLLQRLRTMPQAPTTWPDRRTRLQSLRTVADRLSAIINKGL